MIIVIDESRDVRLVDPLDTKKFHVEIRSKAADIASLGAAFSPYGVLDNREYAWVDASALRGWTGVAEDSRYQAGIASMLGYAARKGWLSPDGTKVRAHIVWIEPGGAQSNT